MISIVLLRGRHLVSVAGASDQGLRSGNQLRSAVLRADVVVVVRTARVCQTACAIASPDESSVSLFTGHDGGVTLASPSARLNPRTHINAGCRTSDAPRAAETARFGRVHR